MKGIIHLLLMTINHHLYFLNSFFLILLKCLFRACFFFFSSAATGLKVQQGDSRLWFTLCLPTTPSYSAPDVPQRGRQPSPGPQPEAVHTHADSKGLQSSGFHFLPPQKPKHIHNINVFIYSQALNQLRATLLWCHNVIYLKGLQVIMWEYVGCGCTVNILECESQSG